MSISKYFITVNAVTRPWVTKARLTSSDGRPYLLNVSAFSGEDQYYYDASIAVDASGAAYVTGITSSTDFPTLNPYQGTFQGNYDAYVTKLSSSGNSLIYSTYLGGSNTDLGNDIEVDAFGAVYIVGLTWSTDYSTLNPFQGTNQGDGDAFVTKLSSSGDSIIYSTYLGGSGSDQRFSIAVDASGAAYVTGNTKSADFPTLNPYQGTNQGPIDGAYGGDAFVTKLSSSGDSIIYSTYLGGNNIDQGFGISVDASGAVYVAGRTGSTDFPTFNPYQGTFQGVLDAFVTKLSSSGDSLVYSTYLGGSNTDAGFGIAVDASGAVYVTGESRSTNFPTLNPYQGIFQGGIADAFVTKLSGSGSSLIYSTYLGGSSYEFSRGIAVDDCGVAYVTGNTSSTDFPMLNPYQGTNQGSGDAFVTKLSGSGNSLNYSTYLGGNGIDKGESIAVDASGAIYVKGNTTSTDFPMLNPYQGTFQGGSNDAFVTKFAEVICCVGMRGDINGDGNDLNIVDLTTIADYLFGVTPPIPCPEESNVNGDCSGLPDIVDLTFVVDWLFGVSPTLVACP